MDPYQNISNPQVQAPVMPQQFSPQQSFAAPATAVVAPQQLPPQQNFPVDPLQSNPQYNQPIPPSSPPATGATVGLPNSKVVSKLWFVIAAAIAAVELIFIIVLVIIVSTSKGAVPAKSSTASVDPLVAQPATTTSVQRSNDAISQTLSSLSDDRDIPADKLSDKNVGL